MILERTNAQLLTFQPFKKILEQMNYKYLNSVWV